MKFSALLLFALISLVKSNDFDPLFLYQTLVTDEGTVTALVSREKAIQPDYSLKSDVIVPKLMSAVDQLQAEVAGVFQTVSRKTPEMISIWLADTVIVKAPASEWRKVLHHFEGIKITANHKIDLIKPIDEPIVGVSNPVNYGLNKIGVDKVWKEFGISGKGVTVGIIDSGWSQHPDLAGKVILSKDFTGEFEGDGPNDVMGHGTHCMGIIGGGNASGTAIGVAPDVKFIVARIFPKDGSGTLAMVLEAMHWIAEPDGDYDTDDRPDIISNSWGSIAQTYLWEPITRWKKLIGILPVFAAGNKGPRKRSVGAPAGYPHAIAVGATDSNDDLAPFSSRGPSHYYRKTYIKPEIVAPGDKIYSAYLDQGYRYWSGTSMATPFISGVAALVLQANPELTVKQLETILLEATRDLGKKGKDNQTGYGLINAYEAVTSAIMMRSLR